MNEKKSENGFNSYYCLMDPRVVTAVKARSAF